MRSSRKSKAFSLVEVTLAIGVASFCLLAVIALLPIGTKVSYHATQETGAANILAAVASDMRATPATATSSNQYGINLGSGAETTLYFDRFGNSSTAISASSTYRVVATATLASPTPPPGYSGTIFVNLKVTWPAAASPENAAGSNQILVAVNQN